MLYRRDEMRFGSIRRGARRAGSLVLLVVDRATQPVDAPSLTVPAHRVERPRFPVIDAHRHLHGPFAGSWNTAAAAELERHLDAVGVERIVDLDGGTGSTFLAEVGRFRSLGERVAVFAGIDVTQAAESDAFGTRMADELRRSVDAGARGLKVWKTLGLSARDRRGRLLAIDDERLDPLWAAAAELDRPVTIHVADPKAFFEPLTRRNERWEELQRHPDWHYWPPQPPGRPDAPGFPTHAALIAQFRAVLERHPGTRFIGAHVAGCAEDLGLVASLLDDHPNLSVDIGARIAELGRQPVSTHGFMVRYADRVLFGVDDPNPKAYPLYYRWLESRDEYFDYWLGRGPENGRWRIYGVGLPDDVLERIYRTNALRIIWGESGTGGG